MHSTKLLEVVTRKKKTISNYTIPCRRWRSTLDLQPVDLASNKENFPLTFSPQRRRSTPQLNQVPLTIERAMWIYETLKTILDVVERGTHSLKKAKHHGTSQ
jgi:hypothetical protein